MPFGDFGDDGRLGVVAFLLLVGAFDDVGDVGGRLGVAGGGVGDDVGDLHGLVDQRVVDGAVGGDELLVALSLIEAPDKLIYKVVRFGIVI